MTRDEEKRYIDDSFNFLVSHVGFIHVRYVSNYTFASSLQDHWTVSINGRLYVETEPMHPTLYVFKCKTEYGMVEVSFPRKG